MLLLLPLFLCQAQTPAGGLVLRGRVEGGSPGRTLVLARAEEEVFETDLPSDPGFGRTKIYETRTDSRNRWRLKVPPGNLYRIWAVAPGEGRVSTILHRRSPHSLSALRLFPASTLVIPGDPGHRFRWTCFARDRETGGSFLHLHGTSDEGRGLRLLLPPGPYRLLLVREDAFSWKAELRLRPRETFTIRPRWSPPRRVFFPEARVPEGGRLRLPTSFAPPGAAFLDPGEGPCTIPALGLLLRVRWESRAGTGPAFDLALPAEGEDRVLDLPPWTPRTLELEGLPSPRPPLHILGHRRAGPLPSRFDCYLEPRARTLAGLPPGDLLLESAGTSFRYLAPVRSGARTAGFSRIPTGSLALEVRTNDLSPPFDLRLRIRPRSLEGLAADWTSLLPSRLAFPDRRGRAYLPRLPAGRHLVLATGPRLVPAAAEIRIRAGEESELHLELDKGARIHGIVKAPDGRPAPGVVVRLRPVAGVKESPILALLRKDLLSDERGEFQFDGLPPDLGFRCEAQRSRGTRSELARRSWILPGPDPVELRLQDEDPGNPGGEGKEKPER